ncbi:MAG: hypothetical protein KQJ78_06170 [Deltaproteobacteria bacterium]|nr:hypothetical protein [Deltaproteobacteria bacterium]
MSCASDRENILKSEGWTRQFVAGGGRLAEAAAAYRELGFEVRLEEVDPAGCRETQGCAACYEDPAARAEIKVIYTRRGVEDPV